MSIRQLLRKPFRLNSSQINPLRPRKPASTSPISGFSIPRRFQSSEATSRARIDRVLNRLPRFLHPYTNGLRTAPVSHIIAFLILHEITAIVPLIGLSYLFHTTQWLPQSFTELKAVREGTEKFGNYFGRKGWFGFEEVDQPAKDGEGNVDGVGQMGERRIDGIADGWAGEHPMLKKEGGQREGKGWRVGERGSRILVEVATAYAITKVLLPVRILVSVWGTPWFARTFIGRVGGLFGRGGRKAASSGSGAAGTGATAGGAVDKAGKNL